MIIDAHQHFWRVERGDYFWLGPQSGVLYRDFGPDDLRPLLQAAGVDKTITVQAADTEAETEYLLGIAEQTDFVAGVVGWLDMDDEDMPRRLERFLEHPKFVGIRPMLQDLPEDDYILRPKVIANLKHLAEIGLPFDFLTLPRHLKHVATALDRVPSLTAIIDHISKPFIARGELDPWRDDIAEVASFPNVYCKVSGMVTEADHSHWRADDLKPYVAHVLQVFGAERLVFGSDWPVALLASDYQGVIDALGAALGPRLSQDEMAGVMGGNAARFYKLAL